MRQEQVKQKNHYRIYVYMQDKDEGKSVRWALHAEAEQKEWALLHAKMLSLKPIYQKIQVEEIYFDDAQQNYASKTIKTISKDNKLASNFFWQRLFGR